MTFMVFRNSFLKKKNEITFKVHERNHDKFETNDSWLLKTTRYPSVVQSEVLKAFPSLGREGSIFLFCEEGSPLLVWSSLCEPDLPQTCGYPPFQPPES